MENETVEIRKCPLCKNDLNEQENSFDCQTDNCSYAIRKPPKMIPAFEMASANESTIVVNMSGTTCVLVGGMLDGDIAGPMAVNVHPVGALDKPPVYQIQYSDFAHMFTIYRLQLERLIEAFIRQIRANKIEVDENDLIRELGPELGVLLNQKLKVRGIPVSGLRHAKKDGH